VWWRSSTSGISLLFPKWDPVAHIACTEVWYAARTIERNFKEKLPNHCYSWYNCLKKRHLQGHCKVNSCATNGFLWADRRIIEDNWRNCFLSVGNRKFCLWPIVNSFWRSLIKRISDVNYRLFLQLSFVPLEMCRRYCVLA